MVPAVRVTCTGSNTFFVVALQIGHVFVRVMFFHRQPHRSGQHSSVQHQQAAVAVVGVRVFNGDRGVGFEELNQSLAGQVVVVVQQHVHPENREKPRGIRKIWTEYLHVVQFLQT